MINEPNHTNLLPNMYTALKDVVKEVSLRFGSNVFFTFGPGQEIVESLNSMSKVNSVSKKKYPLIALVGNTPISVNDRTCFGEGTFNFVIATLTTVNMKAEQRMEKSYVPILQPLANIFIDCISESLFFDEPVKELLSYDYVINFNYARGFDVEGKPYPDFIDAIEIKNLKLRIK